LTGIESDAWLKLDHQPGFTRTRFAKPNLSNGARTIQASGAAEFTRKIDPDPGTAASVSRFEKGLKSRTRSGA
jgi:hypothetical protein